MNQESFGQFIRFLEEVQCSTSNFPGTILLVREPWSTSNPHKLFRQIEDALPVRKIKFDRHTLFEELTIEMGATLIQSISVFLLIERDLSEDLQKLFKEVHCNRKLLLRDKLLEEDRKLPLPSTAKLVAFVERATLEAYRAVADLSLLFGSVISV